MKKIKSVSILIISLFLLINCNSKNNSSKERERKKPTIDKEFITLNGIQIGDNIKHHKKFILSDNQDNFFDIYVNKAVINKLEGNLKLFVSNSIIQKIEFNSGDSFMGSTSIARTLFNTMLEKRKSWIRDAMLNYNITEWDNSKKTAQYIKQNFLHQYNLEKIEAFGVQMGWNMSYIITSKDTERKELQGKKRNLNFGSTKEKKEVKNNTNENKKNQKILTITVDNLRVRTFPDLDSDKIENLTIGSEVEFIEKSDNQTTVTIRNNEITEYWYKVKTPSENIGWIHGCCFNK
ncbi:SH3 domain-containing protein [Tenacibaculum piscium]|uniref:SH3 domain-containing protein n=1 Tax=Tenacibaculum piscium TaxID=1458515 RepID=UPI00187B41AF|nr:SH3 domain-containing protein [Tenacibaculum piscium]MBE7686512.1 SH3 domain-containing protein [Tenacibaculum piscium]